jgi:DNA (cytosine-5)-methyltransferase 1
MAAGGQLIAHALSSHHGRDDINQQDYALVGFANQHRVRTGPVAEPVTGSNRQPGGITDGAMVRRLTPRECERLQGFPDDWTDGQADSVRYRQLGNAVAVPVAEWIIQRLVKAAA